MVQYMSKEQYCTPLQRANHVKIENKSSSQSSATVASNHI